jgi:hypothetical protein
VSRSSGKRCVPSRAVPIIVVLALLCGAGAGLAAQSQSPAQSNAGDSELDSLFNGGSAGTTQPNPTGPGTTPAVRADDITRDNKVHVFGSVDLLGQLGIGWSGFSTPSFLPNGFGWEGGANVTANLGFEVRPATELRIRGTLSYNFPGANPLFSETPYFSEMIIDYSILNAVFFRVGVFDYTWGNSQFFLFGNLPSRSLPDWTGTLNLPFWEKNNVIINTTTTTVPVSLKMNVPFGLNAFTFLLRYDPSNYPSDKTSTTPNPKDAGYGIQYDLVTGPIEWSVAGFYQRLLTPRSLVSMKTSFWGFDFSSELTLASPFANGQFQAVYPTLTTGVTREWTDAHIKLIAEYGYNGERNPGLSLLNDESGPGGHNSAIVLRIGNIGPASMAFNLLWQQNYSDGSGLVAPFLEIAPVPLTTIQIGVPLIYGPDSSEVMNNRLVPGGKRFELLVLVKVSDSFRQ